MHLFPYFADVTESGDADRAEAFRSALRTVVKESPHENLSLVEGTELLDPADLARDVLHPGDKGIHSIDYRLASDLDERVQ